MSGLTFEELLVALYVVDPSNGRIYYLQQVDGVGRTATLSLFPDYKYKVDVKLDQVKHRLAPVTQHITERNAP